MGARIFVSGVLGFAVVRFTLMVAAPAFAAKFDYALGVVAVVALGVAALSAIFWWLFGLESLGLKFFALLGAGREDSQQDSAMSRWRLGMGAAIFVSAALAFAVIYFILIVAAPAFSAKLDYALGVVVGVVALPVAALGAVFWWLFGLGPRNR